MIKTVIKIDGMSCGQCEAHVNNIIRSNFDVKKVTSSHNKNETVVISKDEIDVSKVTAKLGELGYRVLDSSSEPYEKKGLFGF